MKNKLRALCAFMAAVTLFGAVSCKSNETPAETSASSDTVAETRREETDPVETDPVETDPVETEPSDPKDPSDTKKPKVGVVVTVGVLALSAASVIAAVVLPKKRNRKK